MTGRGLVLSPSSVLHAERSSAVFLVSSVVGNREDARHVCGGFNAVSRTVPTWRSCEFLAGEVTLNDRSLKMTRLSL